ncbi:MAG: SRPBCC domain-containing protein [Taibaiella sp.]|nr:SRPBCC domain-containing protein [Taibaiella sp.]
MSNKLSASSSIIIKAPANKVWNGLTDPALIRQYLYGTETTTDWKKGSPITYKGEWQGKQYEDKGTIIDIVPEKLLHTTYFSYMSGEEDKPENYANVIYELRPHEDHTHVTITQDNIKDEEGVTHMKQNWGMVLEGLKKVVEG